LITQSVTVVTQRRCQIATSAFTIPRLLFFRRLVCSARKKAHRAVQLLIQTDLNSATPSACYRISGIERSMSSRALTALTLIAAVQLAGCSAFRSYDNELKETNQNLVSGNVD